MELLLIIKLVSDTKKLLQASRLRSPRRDPLRRRSICEYKDSSMEPGEGNIKRNMTL